MVWQEVETVFGGVMAWKNPLLTGILMLIFIYLCIFMDAERAGALLVFVVLLCLSYGWWRRRSGQYRLGYIEQDGSAIEANDAATNRPFRSIAKLKICVEQVGLAVAGEPEVTGAKGIIPPPVIKTPNGKVSVVISYSIQENAFEPDADLVVGCVSNEHPSSKDLDVDFRLPFAAAAQYMSGDRGSIFRNVVEYDEATHGILSKGQAGGGVSSRPWFLYPILQPIALKSGKMEAQPFTSTSGAIRCRVFLDTDLHAFEEEYLGQVMLSAVWVTVGMMCVAHPLKLTLYYPLIGIYSDTATSGGNYGRQIGGIVRRGSRMVYFGGRD